MHHIPPHADEYNDDKNSSNDPHQINEQYISNHHNFINNYSESMENSENLNHHLHHIPIHNRNQNSLITNERLFYNNSELGACRYTQIEDNRHSMNEFIIKETTVHDNKFDNSSTNPINFEHHSHLTYVDLQDCTC